MERKRLLWFLIAQTLYWGGLAVLIAWINSTASIRASSSLAQQITSVLFPVLGVLISYSIRVVFRRFEWMETGWLYFPRVLLSVILGGIVMAFFVNIPYYLLGGRQDYNLVADTILLSVLILLWMIVFSIIQFANKSKDQELSNAQLVSEKNEIELQVLRSQLNPHFLFNSLNTVRALVDIDPESAKTGISRLATLLRKSLISGKKNLITLKEELEIVSEYIELEKIRFEERVRVVISHDEKLDNVNIPPFIIQTLVENAMKHGITKLIEGGTITLTTTRRESTVFIRIENDGKLASTTDTGVGLENTIRRLELEYKGKASFALYETPTTVVAEIEIRD